jgi:hypothetical protein
VRTSQYEPIGRCFALVVGQPAREARDDGSLHVGIDARYDGLERVRHSVESRVSGNDIAIRAGSTPPQLSEESVNGLLALRERHDTCGVKIVKVVQLFEEVPPASR